MRYKPIIDESKLDTKSQDIMEKFLRRNLPVGRIKNLEKKRFQRGIIVGGEFTNTTKSNYYLTPHEESKELFKVLYMILNNVFGFTSDEIINAVYKYLYM